MTIQVTYLHPQGRDAVGVLPYWLDAADPRPAAEQFNTAYTHGGGWRSFDGFVLRADNTIKYPGDPPYKPMARMQLRDETIFVYPHAWVAVVQPDRSFQICRMD